MEDQIIRATWSCYSEEGAMCAWSNNDITDFVSRPDSAQIMSNWV